MDERTAAGGLHVRAAAALPGPDEPGPFAFAREDRVRRILGDAGFSAIGLEAVDLALDLAMGQGLDVAVESAFDTGPVRRTLEGQPPEVIAKVAGSIRTALAPFQQGERVPLGAAVWIATAVNEG